VRTGPRRVAVPEGLDGERLDAALARMFGLSRATAAELVSESDPKAVALKYKADATKSPDRKDPAAICDNCNLYTGKPGAATGACAALGERRQA